MSYKHPEPRPILELPRLRLLLLHDNRMQVQLAAPCTNPHHEGTDEGRLFWFLPDDEVADQLRDVFVRQFRRGMAMPGHGYDGLAIAGEILGTLFGPERCDACEARDAIGRG